MLAVGGDDAASSSTNRAPFRSLWRWFWPYVRGSRGRLAVTAVVTVIVLACQATIPLQVDGLLGAGSVNVPGIVLLGVLIVVQFVASYLSHLGARDVANDGAFRLRIAVFDAMLHSRVLRQDGLVRSSVVSRHTTDVDHVSEAFERTIAEGFPGAVRVLQSLVLLTWLDWRVGLVMIAATSLFLVTRRIVGAQLLSADRARLDASSRVGESVDESVTASRLISGLHLEPWVSDRFGRRAAHLRRLTHEQGSTVTRLISGAQGAGLVGLFAVVVFGLVFEGDNLSTVAASLLYVEAVVRGLEALPGWIRSLQLGVVSRRRIDQILGGSGQSDPGVPAAATAVSPAAVQPDAGLIGLVTGGGLDDDDVLAAMSTGGHEDPWRITLEGRHVRRPGVGPRALHVPTDAVAFNASVLDHLSAFGPLDDGDVRRSLDAVGLAETIDASVGVEEALGPVGAALTPAERQRLSLAVAMSAHPDLLLIGSLTCMSDAETAGPIIGALRRGGATTVISVASTDMASLMDRMLFVTPQEILSGTHEELLVQSTEYAAIWQRRLNGGAGADLSALGLSGVDEGALHARLVTERLAPGDVVYREGDPADRVIFIVSGHVEITHGSGSGGGGGRRIALLGPGNHIGDLRLTVGERRSETARAVDTCVVQSLSRDAVEAGTSGLLDRPLAERLLVARLLRAGGVQRCEVPGMVPELPEATVTAAVEVLLRDGALREDAGLLHPVLRRSRRSQTSDVLDRLTGL